MILNWRNALCVGVVVLTVAGGISGCSWFQPYHVPVQQGNILAVAETQKLEIGMSKAEVIDAIGAPVLSNTFANNYWTYIYTNQINGGKIEKKQMLLWFSNKDKLIKIDRKSA